MSVVNTSVLILDDFFFSLVCQLYCLLVLNGTLSFCSFLPCVQYPCLTTNNIRSLKVFNSVSLTRSTSDIFCNFLMFQSGFKVLWASRFTGMTPLVVPI